MSGDDITGLAIADRAWRATYGHVDDDEPGGFRVDRYAVIGWAARGPDVWPVRVEAVTGRGVLVGSALDPDRDALLAVLTAGESWEDVVPDADERVRAIIRAHIEIGHAAQG